MLAIGATSGHPMPSSPWEGLRARSATSEKDAPVTSSGGWCNQKPYPDGADVRETPRVGRRHWSVWGLEVCHDRRRQFDSRGGFPATTQFRLLFRLFLCEMNQTAFESPVGCVCVWLINPVGDVYTFFVLDPSAMKKVIPSKLFLKWPPPQKILNARIRATLFWTSNNRVTSYFLLHECLTSFVLNPWEWALCKPWSVKQPSNLSHSLAGMVVDSVTLDLLNFGPPKENFPS